MELRGRRALVIGAGRTGVATSRVLARRGARVRLVDRRPTEPDARSLETLGADVELRLGDESPALLADVDLVVPSPGVPATSPLLTEAVARGLDVVSEIEVAANLLDCPIVAVTGTNGKSTTTTLIGEMLAASGEHAFVGGNLGTPLIEAVEGSWAVAVAEVSSFQLEWVHEFRPAVAVLLNLSPDHLDRHGSMAAYAAVKARIFAAQEETDVAVLNRDDPAVWELRTGLRGRVVSIGFHRDAFTCGAFLQGGEIAYRDATGEVTFALAGTRLEGRHHLEDMMAAISAARLCGASPAAIQSVLDSFPGLPHRCEFVHEARGVRYYDDSKATNVGAVVKALHSLPGRVVLLAGGLDKGGDFTALRPIVAERVRLVVAYGVARRRIREDLGDAVPVECVESFSDAVRKSVEAAKSGDVVLLSPACASFDQFVDYAERGTAFRILVGGGALAASTGPSPPGGGCR